MTAALWLFAVQGIVGAFDTLYYHEWRARLPGGAPGTSPELRLHAVRDFLYAVLFGTLPWVAWQGAWALVLSAALLTEILLTHSDFIVEARVRKPLGDVYAGERVTHAVMGILYGCALANLAPILWKWGSMPSAFVGHTDVPEFLRWTLSVFAAGVLLSGIRDLYAALGLPHGDWPWSGVQRVPGETA